MTNPTRRRIVAMVALCATPGVALHKLSRAAETLRIVTEELPPYNMTRHGHITGLGTDVVEAVLRQVGFSATIESMPWPRAYDTALRGDNVLIYSIDRTRQREALFKWIGQIGPPDENFLYALPQRHLVLKHLDDARRWRIATSSGNSDEQYLLSQGFVLGVNLIRNHKVESGYELLRLGHVDLWASGEVSAPYYARDAGDDPTKTLVAALALPEVSTQSGLSMAFSMRTPDGLVQRFRDGLQAIRRSGAFDAIQRSWR